MHTVLKKAASLILFLAFLGNFSSALAAEPAAIVSQTAVTSSARQFRSSGRADLAKLSQQEIAQLLSQAPDHYNGPLFDQTPSCQAPFSAGTVTVAALQAATARLNALRRIAGLPAVTLDEGLCSSAQYGAVIQATRGSLSHTPAAPADMSTDFYQKACAASSSSNLAAGYSLVEAVDGLMEDSSPSNIQTLGHRRWQLSPLLGKVGFGYAESNTRYRCYTAEKVFDTSAAPGSYDFISWPASGNFPTQLIQQRTAWSISLNHERFQTPTGDVRITVTREADGKTWALYTGCKDGLFSVTPSGYGPDSCISFRPGDGCTDPGTYTVRVSGLKTADGQAVTDFSYQVILFDLNHLAACS